MDPSFMQVSSTSRHVTVNLIPMETHLHETVIQDNINKNDESSLKTWNSSSESFDKSEKVPSDNFDCSICLANVQDPVVTLCGHLYCWPCIYKWIHLSHKVNTLCPICKTEISEKTLIPLYVPNPTTKPTSLEKTVSIPHRPFGVQVLPSQQLTFRDFRREVPNVVLPVSPTTGMFGEIVYEGLFGNLQDALFGYQDSYGLAGISTLRARRRAIRDERSLGRLCFFLLCCVTLCLFLF